jgi:hypothetical protein
MKFEEHSDYYEECSLHKHSHRPNYELVVKNVCPIQYYVLLYKQ